MKLRRAVDGHFAWMLGLRDPPDGLTLPPGGVDEGWVLRWLWGVHQKGGGVWLMVEGGEVVGLASHKGPPDAEGVVEIGYAVAPAHRRRGHASDAAAQLIALARADPRIRRLTAETALANLPSQKVVAANGFAQSGRSQDADEGEMIVWTLAV